MTDKTVPAETGNIIKWIDNDDVNRNDTEKEIEAGEERFRSLVEITSDWIWEVDKHAVYTYVSPKVKDLLGYKPEEIIGRTPFDLMPEDESIRVREIFWQGASQAQTFEKIENVNLHKDGRAVVLETSAVPIFDGKGELLGYRGVDRDITERKRLEKELENHTRRMFQGILDESPVGICVYDPEGQCIIANDSLGTMVGAAKEQVLAQKWTGIESWKKCGLFEKALRAMNEGIKEQHEITTTSTFGKEVALLCHLVPYRVNDETYLLFMAGDISDLKAAEKEREYLESCLFKAQKMEAIGTLAGGIAHDFNNILSPIMGYIELMFQELGENRTVKGHLMEVYRASVRAKKLIKQILAFSRGAECRKNPVKVQLVIDEAMKLLRPTIPANIEIKKSIDKNCRPILADISQIHRVVVNLCINAYHAMEKGGGTMTVSLAMTGANSDGETAFSGLKRNDHLLLRVSDTGHGMDDGIREKIFDPYFTTKQTGKGSGMGLAMVHGIVKSCGGKIRVCSEINKGTTVDIFLPVIEENDVDTEIISIYKTQQGTERILFVDDELTVVQMEKKRLKGLGYRVTERASSVEALEAFRASPDRFDLVITDMTMPNMTGMELARELIQIRPDIRIILCTGYNRILDEEEIRKIGIKGILMKPITIQELSDTIRRVLDGE